jgi:hypothetical protein
MTADAIAEDVGGLLKELTAHGYSLTDSRYDPADFGNYYVELSGSDHTFRIIRDRGQYHLEGEHERLKALGLMRSFAGLPELKAAVLKYLDAP